MDKRVQKTKKVIRNAFMALLAEKEISKLTMKEIAECANVDRKTLYNYYKNVSELFEEIENELIANFETALGEWEFDTMEHTKGAFMSFANHLKENMETYTLLTGILKNAFITSKTVEYLKDKIRSVLVTVNVPQRKIDLAAEYIAHGMFAAYRLWFSSNRDRSLEEFTTALATIVMGGARAYFQS